MGEFINAKSLEPAGGELIPEADEKFDDTFGDIDDVSLSGNVEKDYATLIHKLQDTGNVHLNEALEKICHDPKLYTFISKAFGESELANVRISRSPTAIPVKSLLSCRKEFSLDDSLLFALNSDNLNGKINMFTSPATVIAPIITYRKSFIIDGHHRWAELYAMNPNSMITAINIDYEQDAVWKPLWVFQSAITVADSDFHQSSKENTLRKMSEDQIRGYVTQNITDVCVRSLICANAKNEDITVTDRDSAIEYIVLNAQDIKRDNLV